MTDIRALPRWQPQNWFWIVSGDSSRAWSSSAGAYVSHTEADADRTTKIASEAELNEVLRRHGLICPLLDGVIVDAERDRRLQLFTFAGVLYDFDEQSRALIDKARVSAMNYIIVAGPQPGNLRWADANQDFGWIAADNTFHTMDAETCLSFGTAAASWEGRHILAARAIKNLSTIPADYASDARWP